MVGCHQEHLMGLRLYAGNDVDGLGHWPFGMGLRNGKQLDLNDVRTDNTHERQIS